MSRANILYSENKENIKILHGHQIYFMMAVSQNAVI